MEISKFKLPGVPNGRQLVPLFTVSPVTSPQVNLD